MRFRPIIFISCVFTHVTTALYAGRLCPLACELTIEYASFNDTDPWLSRKVRSCRSELRTISLYLCFDQFCAGDEDIEHWIQSQIPWCREHAGTILPAFHDVVDRWSSGDKARVKRLGVDEAMKHPVSNEVTIPYATFFDRAFTTMDAAYSEYDTHRVYGWYMYYFWSIVVMIGITTRLWSFLQNLSIRYAGYKPYSDSDFEYSTKHRNNLDLPRTWIKRYLTIPAAFNGRCSRPYGWCTLPPRVQSLTILIFVLFNLVICTCSYRLTDGNLYWPQRSAQLLRYLSDRTGIISLANLPLVWIFGMRNDFLMWLTGWGFGTYNAFHRWVARVATAQAVVHSLGYTLMIVESGGWTHFRTYWTKHYFWNGELATIAMCSLLAFSFYGIRRAHYEFFLITHIILSVIALWTMYYHVEIFTDGEWNIFIWPCLALWALDRCFRISRILAFNRNPFNTKATIRFDPSSNLVRMDVDGSRNWIMPEPGTYYYIHVLDDLLYAYQSHPFTLAYVSSDTMAPPVTLPASSEPRPLTHRTLSPISNGSSESDALLSQSAAASTYASSNMVFLIRPYDGFTSRLKSHCLLHPKELRVLVEGPYGHTVPLHRFVNVLFVVGGTGVAVPLSHLSHLLSASSQVQSVKVVWAVREHAFLASVLRDFRGLLGDKRVEMEVHITRDEEAKDDVLGEDLRSVRIMTHRPNVRAVVEAAAQDTRNQDLAVVACGPALMSDEARKACVEMLGAGYHGVEYFEESFKW